MDIYFFHISTIPRLESYTDRNLVGKLQSFSESDNNLTLSFSWDDVKALNRLEARKNFALQYSDNSMRYFELLSYEVSFDSNKIEVEMQINPI